MGRFCIFLSSDPWEFNLIEGHFNDKNCHLSFLGRYSAGRFRKMGVCRSAENGPGDKFLVRNKNMGLCLYKDRDWLIFNMIKSSLPKGWEHLNAKVPLIPSSQRELAHITRLQKFTFQNNF